MAEGTDNVEDRLSCDDSSYDERNLEVYDSGDVEARTRNMAVVIRTRWERSLTSLPTGTDRTTFCILFLLVPKMVLTLFNLRWCLFSVDPICICTYTNEHVLQLTHCGGCCIWW